MKVGESIMSKKEQVRVKKASLHYYRYKKNWTSEQKKNFREIAEELIKAEILAEVDIPVLERLIELRSQMDKLNDMIMKSKDGKEMKSLMGMNNQLQQQSLKIEESLGLTPKSRLMLTPLAERQDYNIQEKIEISDNWEDDI